jgi:CheY-like chemotaxis protein
MFWIELRAAEPLRLLPEAGQAIAEAMPQDDSPQQRPTTLLYVEDNPANLKLVQEIISFRPDLTLLSAPDGHLGIELARVHHPDIILMDINLPGVNGIDALKLLKQDPATSHIPVIALTANAMPRDVEKGIAAGFFRYLIKPINIDEFTDAINSTLAYIAERKANRVGT